MNQFGNEANYQDSFNDLYSKAAAKLCFALNQLIQSQGRDPQLRYPFAILNSPLPKLCLVHLGGSEILKLCEFDKIESVFTSQQEHLELQNPFSTKRSYKTIKVRKRRTKTECFQSCMNGSDQKATKNIPKNYAKAIMNFIQKRTDILNHLLSEPQDRQIFLQYIKGSKYKIQNIKQFSFMLSPSVGDEIQKKWNKIFRIFCNIFIKHEAVSYIFNSRIVQDTWHLRYRNDIKKALKYPDRFKKVKIK